MSDRERLSDADRDNLDRAIREVEAEARERHKGNLGHRHHIGSSIETVIATEYVGKEEVDRKSPEEIRSTYFNGQGDTLSEMVYRQTVGMPGIMGDGITGAARETVTTAVIQDKEDFCALSPVELAARYNLSSEQLEELAITVPPPSDPLEEVARTLERTWNPFAVRSTLSSVQQEAAIQRRVTKHGEEQTEHVNDKTVAKAREFICDGETQQRDGETREPSGREGRDRDSGGDVNIHAEVHQYTIHIHEHDGETQERTPAPRPRRTPTPLPDDGGCHLNEQGDWVGECDIDEEGPAKSSPVEAPRIMPSYSNYYCPEMGVCVPEGKDNAAGVCEGYTPTKTPPVKSTGKPSGKSSQPSK